MADSDVNSETDPSASISHSSKRVKERRHYTEDCLQDDEIEGRRMFTVEDKVTSPAFTCTFVKEMKGEDFSLKYFQENGFEYPMLFKSKANMGMRLPSHNFTCNDVRQCVGSRRILDVMDVTTQKDIEMTMKDWCRYFENPNRDKLLNVISLEFSHTKLENYVESPSVVRQVDWVDVVWPRHLKELQTEGTNAIEDMRYPKVQKYCLMSVKGCYTDFHIDFGGTSVWYHLLRGQKVFWLIPPTKRNFQLYEQWVLSGKQGDVFFGETVEKCDRVTLNEGDTFFIPTGWIHAVYTPVDALVFGGNFLHSYGIEKQLQIAQIEDATHVPLKFRYPFYREMLWYVLQRYVQCLLGINHLTCNEDGDPVEAPRRGAAGSRPSPAGGPFSAGAPLGSQGAPGDGSSFLDLSTLSPKPLTNGNPGSSPTMQAEDSMDSADEPGRRTYAPGHVHLTRREIDGIRMIIRWLQKLPANKKFVPDLVRDPDALLADAKRLVKEHKHDDPLLAVTDKPVLFWPESKKKSKPRVGGPPSGKHSSKGGGRGSDKDKNGARRRRTRCKKCEACLRADCGDCHFCKDMKKFGGPGRMKQSCISRQCMAPVLPHTACCMLCGRDGWEKGAPPQPCDQEACSSLMECSQCWEIVHPACLHERHPALRGAQGCVSDDLPNSWECPKCCRDGKPDQPRHTRGRVSKGPHDGRPDSECTPCGDATGGSSPVARGNPALNLTLRPHEAAAAAAELSSSELDVCGAPAKKKIKTEGPQEPLEYDGMPLSDDPVQQVQPAASNGDISDEDMCKDNVGLDASALNRPRKDDYVRSCSRLTVAVPDKKPVIVKSSHDQIVQSMRGLHKGSEPEAAEAAALPLSVPPGGEFVSRTDSPDSNKEDRNPTANGGAPPEYILSGASHPGDFKLKMTLRDRGNLRKPRYVVRPAPLPEDLEKAKMPPAVQLPADAKGPCYALLREAMLPVLRYLTPRELSQCQLVCKAWNRWCVEPGMWRRVDLSRRRVTAHALAGIVRRQPTCLDLAWTNVSAKQLSWLLPRLPHLRELGLSGCSAAAVVAALRSGVCPGLRCLDLSWVEGLGDQAVRDLVAPDARSKPRLLVEVRLAGCDISDVAVRLLGHQLPQLSRLDLSDCRGVTDMGIAVLGAAKASRLTALDVSRCANVSDTGLEALRRCSGLRHLDLRDCPQVTDSACRRFVAQSRLPVELKESKLIELVQA
ncbi:lysine-specific demethylase 2B isoform X2 [Ixodes scapularis]|uniref:lysine-specific demethylase 2B isoform X2 n=1 Tax=Ixodes scapularis TaxID=6945 RepID=UPI001A9E7327|nr:lysine-specific demethylase 2B isoform X2 [Ixodes scapularis]